MILRLIITLLFSRWRKPCDFMGPCLTPFRVMPRDLDILMHVNNGIYLSMMDLARIDLMIRSGVEKHIKALKMYPVVAGQAIEYKKSLRLFQKFYIETRVLGWDERSFYLRQTFRCKEKDVAVAIVRANFLNQEGRTVAPARLADLLGFGSKTLSSEWLNEWVKVQRALRESI